jgi:hypothetical protein
MYRLWGTREGKDVGHGFSLAWFLNTPKGKGLIVYDGALALTDRTSNGCPPDGHPALRCSVWTRAQGREGTIRWYNVCVMAMQVDDA